MMVELRECWHCGSDRMTVWNIRDGQQAVCKDCKTAVFYGRDQRTTRGEAATSWNTRASDTRIVELEAKVATLTRPATAATLQPLLEEIWAELARLRAAGTYNEGIKAAAQIAEGWPTSACGDNYQTSGNGRFWDAGTIYDQGRVDAANEIRSLRRPDSEGGA